MTTQGRLASVAPVEAVSVSGRAGRASSPTTNSLLPSEVMPGGEVRCSPQSSPDSPAGQVCRVG